MISREHEPDVPAAIPLREAERPDADLVAAVNAGPPGAEAAFAAIYRRHKDFCFRTAVRITHDPQTAMDAVQEAFIHLARQFPGFSLSGKLTTYLYPVVRHRALGLARRERRTPDPARLAPPGDASPTPENDLAPLRAALEDLPDIHREVLVLRVVEGLDVSATAQALGLPTGTVKSRLHKAIARLREDPRTQAYFS